MHIHIVGICGTFMGGLAILAKELGHTVSGSDVAVYPPMSVQLQEQGIRLMEGFSADNLEPRPELVIIGNALSRGNPEVEAVLNQGLSYTSGAQWLGENVLYKDRYVLAVAGTHGKTTTASILAWILETAGFKPGFLIGGLPGNFGVSARLSASSFFVIEADEYDTAFFDKRPKFIHYRPRTLVLNNLEYDHADIFADIDAIKLQFHYLLRTVPQQGQVIINADEPELKDVLNQGCWSQTQFFNQQAGWQARPLAEDGSRFEVLLGDQAQGVVCWDMVGRHNVSNALAAMAAAAHAGVTAETAIAALSSFAGIKRRLELRGTVNDIAVYDDFAHHPTSIRETLAAMRARAGDQRIVAVMEPRSNTMRQGVHRKTLAPALSIADKVIMVAAPNMAWSPQEVIDALGPKAKLVNDVDEALTQLMGLLEPNDTVVVMSNGGFGNIHERLLRRLGEQVPA